MKTNSSRMSRCAVVLASCLSLLASAPARAASPVAGVVISMEGKAEFQKAGEEAFRPLKFNEMLREGDVVKTGHGVRVGIAFVGGAELRINENSSFKMESGGGSKPTSVFTQFGNAWTRLLHGKSGMRVRTPNAVAAVRGTEADVNYGTGPMTVKVYEGFVDVTNAKGTTALRAGQQTQVAGSGQAPEPARAMSPQDYGTWQNALKAVDLNKSLKILEAAAVKDRALDLDMKDKDGKSKKVRMRFEKK
ncbi:MAG: FecR domain-containing protein [Elusimicrobia bacterium]|nr:FecR domain-containing protein [Elusimicrobiota bacterium]